MAGMRMVFSLGASLVCAVIPPMIWGAFEEPARGLYGDVACVRCVFLRLPWIGTFFKTKEREEYMHEPKRKGNIFVELVATLKVKSFRKLVYMYLCSFLALDVITTLFIYFMTYYLNRQDMAQFVLGALILVEICSIPLAVFIAKKTSKKFSFRARQPYVGGFRTVYAFCYTPEMSISCDVCAGGFNGRVTFNASGNGVFHIFGHNRCRASYTSANEPRAAFPGCRRLYARRARRVPWAL